jgi:hypothetical protein
MRCYAEDVDMALGAPARGAPPTTGTDLHRRKPGGVVAPNTFDEPGYVARSSAENWQTRPR